MDTTHNSPDDLESVQGRFQEWRAGRKGLGGRVPQNLREAAVGLLNRYSLSQVCGALSLKYHTLRRYCDEAKERGLFGQGPAAADFLQVTSEQLASGGAGQNDSTELHRAMCSIIFERIDGSRLTVRLPADSRIIESLCASFIGR